MIYSGCNINSYKYATWSSLQNMKPNEGTYFHLSMADLIKSDKKMNLQWQSMCLEVFQKF